MAVIQCENGHFYDESKFIRCPHCETLSLSSGEALRTDRTVSMKQPPVPMPPADEEELDRTVSIFSRGQGKRTPGLPVGWLVCTEGPEQGREHRLVAGRNFAGRGLGMDICLSGDPEIDPSEQFSVVYDPLSGRFSLVPGKGTLTYLNGEVLSSSAPLRDYDSIRAGGTTLVLRSFCGEDFQW